MQREKKGALKCSPLCCWLAKVWLMLACQWPWYSTPHLRHRLSRQRQPHLGSIKIQEAWGGAGENETEKEACKPGRAVIWDAGPHSQASVVTHADLTRTGSAVYLKTETKPESIYRTSQWSHSYTTFHCNFYECRREKVSAGILCYSLDLLPFTWCVPAAASASHVPGLLVQIKGLRLAEFPTGDFPQCPHTTAQKHWAKSSEVVNVRR